MDLGKASACAGRRPAAAAAIALTSGCFIFAAGAAAGAGTVAYVEGKLTATLANPYERVVRATSLAMQQLKFLEVSESRDTNSYELKARTTADKKSNT